MVVLVHVYLNRENVRFTMVVHCFTLHKLRSCLLLFMAGDNTVELQWLEHLWDHENMFETRVDRASEC